MNIQVYFKDLSEIKLYGSTRLFTKGDIRFLNDLNLNVSGSTVGELSLNCEKVIINAMGSSVFTFSGKARNAYLSCSGHSTVSAKDLIIENCKATVSGHAMATIHVTNNLDVEARNGSTVYYYGNPIITDLNAVHASMIKKLK